MDKSNQISNDNTMIFNIAEDKTQPHIDAKISEPQTYIFKVNGKIVFIIGESRWAKFKRWIGWY